jgi:hypothetical protein
MGGGAATADPGDGFGQALRYPAGTDGFARGKTGHGI